jgi:hypothetical protein
MTSFVGQWTLDVQDVDLMAGFWAQVFGYRIDRGDDGSAKLYPPDDAPETAPTVWLQPTATTKIGKNRCHLDLSTVGGDPAAEVDRLVTLGARRVDVGQSGDEPFTVLADPEGNEFCLLDRPPRRV